MQATKESGGSKEHTFTPPVDAVLEVQQPPRFHLAAGCLRRRGFGNRIEQQGGSQSVG